jgi:hypothetical protein
MRGLWEANVGRAPLARRSARAAGVASLAALALALAPGSSLSAAVSRAAEVVPDLNPEPPHVAYVTETATSISKVWLAAANGSDPKLLGEGQQPLLSPDGESVAASLFGATVGDQEQGPSIGVYAASGAPVADYLSLETAVATPLAWSADSRYLAVGLVSNGTNDIADDSGLDVIDTQTGTVRRIAAGTIYGASFAPNASDRLVFGRSHSESFAGGVNLYVSEADGAGLHRITADGRSLDPIWGPSYIAYDRERARKLSPEDQIWLATPAGVRVRRLTHIAVGALTQGLVPLAFSADGGRLLAELEGEDQSEAYAVNVATGRARPVIARGNAVIGAGISADGSTLLVDEDAFEQPLSHARIATIPFAGGHSTVIVAHGSQASWND